MCEADITENVEVANRAFAMLICTHVFVLRHLLKSLPVGADAMVARRRWVLVEVPPPSLRYEDDVFAVVINSLHSADTVVMLEIAHSMLHEIVGNENFPHE